MEESFSLKSGLDRAALGARWRTIRPGSPFLTWTWILSWMEATGAAPILLCAARGTSEALGLICRVAGTGSRRVFALTQCGDAARDTPFVEHNGLTGGASDPATLRRLAAFLAAARREGPLAGWDELRLAGVPRAWADGFAEAGFEVAVRAVHPVHAIDLDALRRIGAGQAQAGLAAGARWRIGRASRLYGGRAALRVERATGRAACDAALTHLEELHQGRWLAAGRPGAFASPVFADMVRRVVARGVPAGEAELLRIDAGERTIGVMLNLIAHGHVASYVTGFVREADNRLKPGLVCHCLAMDMHLREGRAVYDLLAGDARYKRELAPPGGELLWLTVLASRRPAPWITGLRTLARRMVERDAPAVRLRAPHRRSA